MYNSIYIFHTKQSQMPCFKLSGHCEDMRHCSRCVAAAVSVSFSCICSTVCFLQLKIQVSPDALGCIFPLKATLVF